MPFSIKAKTVALIGGAGLIGHNLAIRLKELGADVHIVDSLQVNNLMSFVAWEGAEKTYESGHRYRRIVDQRLTMLHDAGIPLHLEDARDYHRLCHLLDTIRPNVIIHLAAVAHANQSNKDPHSTFDHSLRTLENALDNARGNGVERFIYLSSSMVYGNFTDGMVTEESPCEPIGIYGALKFAGEKIVIAYNQVFDLPYTIIRPSAIYGDRDVGRRVVQLFIEAAMKGEDLTIQGDGTESLDFTYVDDFVSGVVSVVGNEAAKNEIFNLTHGQSRTLAELADLIQLHFPGITVVNVPRNKLMPRRGTLSIEKARRVLGYDPRYPLEKGLESYVNWYRNELPQEG